jgi:hypothetical protein
VTATGRTWRSWGVREGPFGIRLFDVGVVARGDALLSRSVEARVDRALGPLVRLVLVPAVMELLGRANWWLPGWLETGLARWLPGVGTASGGVAQAVAGTRAGDPAWVR